MSQSAKAELIRRQLAKEAKEDDFEENYVKGIIRVAARMGGWKISDILQMPILRYMAVTETLNEDDEKNRRSMEQTNSRQTFR